MTNPIDVGATMRAAVMNRTGRLDLEERPLPEIGPKDVLVAVGYVGVCGSDMALFQNGYIGESVVTAPMVLGHEASGTVVRVGADVADLRPGMRVALEPGVPCMDCEFCFSGRYNLCPDVYFWASLPVTEGAFQEYVRHPASFCHVLPDGVGLLEGALIEPLSVAFHAVDRSGAGLGDTAVVLGAGCIGLLTLLALRASGVRDVVVVDLVENRLELAARLGASVLNAAEVDDVFAEIAARFGHGPDFVFETAGNRVTMDQSIRMVKRGGVITFVGYTKDGRADLNVNLLIDKEVTLKTVFRYRNTYPRAIAAVSSGAIDLEGIVSAVYPLDDVQRGMEQAVHNKADVTKCVIRVSPEA
ncbi:MAG: NAD(P)-dependent alcohol dehydrogenase [Microbacterium sp.]